MTFFIGVFFISRLLVINIMRLVKKIYQFLGLDEKINQILTLGLANNTVFFFYGLLQQILPPNQCSLVVNSLLFVVSTCCFSILFKKKGVIFQKKVLTKWGVIPIIVSTLICLELFFTIKLRRGLIFVFVLELCLLLLAIYINPAFRIVAPLLRHLIFFYVLFRSLVDTLTFDNLRCIQSFFRPYTVVYKSVQEVEVKINRTILILIVFLTLSFFHKLLDVWF